MLWDIRKKESHTRKCGATFDEVKRRIPLNVTTVVSRFRRMNSFVDTKQTVYTTIRTNRRAFNWARRLRRSPRSPSTSERRREFQAWQRTLSAGSFPGDAFTANVYSLRARVFSPAIVGQCSDSGWLASDTFYSRWEKITQLRFIAAYIQYSNGVILCPTCLFVLNHNECARMFQARNNRSQMWDFQTRRKPMRKISSAPFSKLTPLSQCSCNDNLACWKKHNRLEGEFLRRNSVFEK